MGRNYWMKVRRDFFKRHDMRILRAEGGRDAVLFYIELLCESIDHDGRLRYSEKKAYTPKRLATALDFPEDIAKKALDILQDLDLLQTEEDGTLYLPEAEHMTGSESEWAEKKRTQRGHAKDKKGTTEGQPEDNVPQMSPDEETTEGQSPTEKEIELDIEIDLEKELELEIKKEREEKKARPQSSTKRFKAPTIEEITAYCQERKNRINPEQFLAYYEANGWKVGKNQMKDWRAAIRSWETREGEMKAGPHQEAVPYMQKEYTREYLEQKERDDLTELLEDLTDD